MLDSSLDTAYRATTYLLTVSGQQVPVRVGVSATELAAPLERLNVQRWGFITAWNPRSEMLSTPENARLNARLFQSLIGENFGPAIALPDDDSWPRESGFVIFDMPMSKFLGLAERFEQNAVIVGRGADVPELIWVGKSV